MVLISGVGLIVLGIPRVPKTGNREQERREKEEEKGVGRIK